MQTAGFNVSIDCPCMFQKCDMMTYYNFPLERCLSLQSTSTLLCYVLWLWHSEV